VQPLAPKVNGNKITAKCFGTDAEANARLIAAAPDMLAALKIAERRIAELARAVCVLAGNPKKVRADDYSEEIRAVIAKAEKGELTQ
jgi:hypothetical protein